MEILSHGGKDYGDRRKCKMNRKQIKMDWWVVLTFLKTTFSLLSVAAEFTRNRLLLALFPRRLWGSTRHILCLTAERDVAELPAGCHCRAPGSSRVLGGRNIQEGGRAQAFCSLTSELPYNLAVVRRHLESDRFVFQSQLHHTVAATFSNT